MYTSAQKMVKIQSNELKLIPYELDVCTYVLAKDRLFYLSCVENWIKRSTSKPGVRIIFGATVDVDVKGKFSDRGSQCRHALQNARQDEDGKDTASLLIQ